MRVRVRSTGGNRMCAKTSGRVGSSHGHGRGHGQRDRKGVFQLRGGIGISELSTYVRDAKQKACLFCFHVLLMPYMVHFVPAHISILCYS